jgi:hypothetical protein
MLARAFIERSSRGSRREIPAFASFFARDGREIFFDHDVETQKKARPPFGSRAL